MVPTNSFADPLAFNFIFRACTDCNNEKARLEDHISAVTLLTSPGRTETADIDEEAKRKASNSFDPRQRGLRIADVRQDSSVERGGIFTFGLVAGPQPDPRQVALLAFRHVQGLFSLSTSADPLIAESTRLLPANHFGIFGHYAHRDWGNPQLVEISRRARSIPSVVDVTTATGYFRCALRRGAASGSPWFWALEWNKSLRVTGWIGDSKAPPAIFSNLPSLDWQDLRTQSSSRTRIRRETPLAKRDDFLFDVDSADDEAPN
jgi:hypothetical protein